MKTLRFFCFFLSLTLFVTTLAISGSYTADLKEVDAFKAAGKNIPDPVNPWPVQALFIFWAVILFSFGLIFHCGIKFIEKRKKRISKEVIDQILDNKHPLHGDGLRYWRSVH